MPEEHGNLIRLRTSMPGEAFERFERLADLVGLPVERVIGLAAVQALPAFEQRIRVVLGLEAAGGLDAAGHASASDAGEVSGRVLNEERPVYASAPRGPGGGKRRKSR